MCLGIYNKSGVTAGELFKKNNIIHVVNFECIPNYRVSSYDIFMHLSKINSLNLIDFFKLNYEC